MMTSSCSRLVTATACATGRCSSGLQTRSSQPAKEQHVWLEMSRNGATAESVEERHTVAARVAWSVWTFTVVLLSAIWPILIIPRLDLLSDPSVAFPLIAGSIFVLVTATVGALIASR